jgi:hypothetical protein
MSFFGVIPDTDITSDLVGVNSGPWANAGREYAIRLTNNNEAINPHIIDFFAILIIGSKMRFNHYYFSDRNNPVNLIYSLNNTKSFID